MQRIIRRLLPSNLSNYNLTRHMACKPKSVPLYSVRHAYPPDYDRVVKFMMETYLKTEPSLVNIGLAPGPINPSLVRMMELHVHEGMTLIALDRKNCIVGAAVNLVSREDTSEVTRELLHSCCECEKTRQYFEFFAYVSKQANLWCVYGTDQIFECSHLAVHPEHQGKGIARRLVAESWVLARDLNYKLFRIDATSLYTARIADFYAWKCIYSLPYRRYFADSDFVFKCVKDPHTEVRMYVDRLDWTCDYYPPTRRKESDSC